MRRLVKKYFPAAMYAVNAFARFKYRNQSVQEVFDGIYRGNRWEGDDSVSGQGSDLEQTEAIREALPEIFRDFEIRSMIDVPCGDFFWMNQVDLGDIRYTGADIVAPLVEQCRERYGAAHREFRQHNLVDDELAAYDLVFVRDCFVHLALADVQKALANIRRSGSKYLMTTTFPEKRTNMDIATGGWRWLNFEKPPFDFPPPLRLINERCAEGKKFVDKSMAVWRISDLP